MAPISMTAEQASALVLLAHSPKLKTLRSDGLFDDLAGEFMRRVAIGRDGADRVPGSELFWQTTAVQFGGERMQVRSGVGLEDKYSHGRASLYRHIIAGCFNEHGWLRPANGLGCGERDIAVHESEAQSWPLLLHRAFIAGDDRHPA